MKQYLMRIDSMIIFTTPQIKFLLDESYDPEGEWLSYEWKLGPSDVWREDEIIIGYRDGSDGGWYYKNDEGKYEIFSTSKWPTVIISIFDGKLTTSKTYRLKMET